VDVLVKPFSSGEIVAKVKEVLGDGAFVPGLKTGPIYRSTMRDRTVISIDEDKGLRMSACLSRGRP